MANTKDGPGLVKHFLSKQGTTGYVKLRGKAINRGGGQIACEYVFSEPKTLMESLESLFELSTIAAVRSNKTEQELDVENKTKWRTPATGNDDSKYFGKF